MFVMKNIKIIAIEMWINLQSLSLLIYPHFNSTKSTS